MKTTMRTLLLSAVMLLAANNAVAQLSTSVRFGYKLTQTDDKQDMFDFDLCGLYRFDSHWTATAGLGLGCAKVRHDIFITGTEEKKDEECILPVFAELRYKLFAKGVSPFVAASGGYTKILGSGNLDDPGWFVQPAVGVYVPTKSKTSLFLQVGLQFNESYDTHRQDFMLPYGKDSKSQPYRHITFTLGVEF